MKALLAFRGLFARQASGLLLALLLSLITLAAGVALVALGPGGNGCWHPLCASDPMAKLEDDLSFVPEQFSGRARLFPLPNLVLFPHVMQPLHIFEERYVEMFRDAIDADRLIAMALLQPGWENDYEGRPPIAPVACLGRVVTWQSQEDSRYNLLLLGLRRVRVVQ